MTHSKCILRDLVAIFLFVIFAAALGCGGDGSDDGSVVDAGTGSDAGPIVGTCAMRITEIRPELPRQNATVSLQGLVTLDDEERAQIYIDMQKLWEDEFQTIWITHGVQAYAHTPGVAPATTPHGTPQYHFFGPGE